MHLFSDGLVVLAAVEFLSWWNLYEYSFNSNLTWSRSSLFDYFILYLSILFLLGWCQIFWFQLICFLHYILTFKLILWQVGGLGDVVSGLGKALQKKGHLVEIVLPKYDCMQYDRVCDLRVCYFIKSQTCWYSIGNWYLALLVIIWLLFQALDVLIDSYFDRQLYKNKIWVGTIEGQQLNIYILIDCLYLV